jgi:deoxyadenosine/deoxycytidine kinase
MYRFLKDKFRMQIDERPIVCSIALSGPVGAGKTTSVDKIVKYIKNTLKHPEHHDSQWVQYKVSPPQPPSPSSMAVMTREFSMATAHVNSHLKFKILIANDFDKYLEHCPRALEIINQQEKYVVKEEDKLAESLEFQRYVIDGQKIAAQSILSQLKNGWRHVVIWDRPTVDHLAFCEMFGILDDILEDYVELRITEQVLHVERIFYFDISYAELIRSIVSRRRPYEINFWNYERLNKWEDIWCELASDPSMPDGCSKVIRVNRENAAMHAMLFIAKYFNWE